MKTLHGRCAGLDVHKVEVVACMRLVEKGKVARQVRRFPTTTQGLLEMVRWLEGLCGDGAGGRLGRRVRPVGAQVALSASAMTRDFASRARRGHSIR